MDTAANQETRGIGYQPSLVEVERRNRIRVAVAAYAVECWDNPIMKPGDYDCLAENIHRELATGHNSLDRFFACEFTPLATDWVRDHPEIDKIEKLYKQRIKA